MLSYSATLTLYFFTISSAVLFASLSQKVIRKQNTINVLFSKGWFFLAFLVLWFVSVCTDIGVDRLNYLRIIRDASLENIWGVEPGFNILSIVLRNLCGGNEVVAYSVLKTITLILFFRAMYLLRNDVKLGYAMLAFVLLAYFRFYLCSMQIASALLLLSSYYLMKQKNFKTWLYFILAFSMHYSVMLLIVAYGLYYFLSAQRKKMSKIKIALIAITYFVGFYFTYQLFEFATSTFSFFSNYKLHGAISQYSGLGIMMYIFYIPLFYFAALIYKADTDKKFINMTMVFTLTGFLFGMLGYRLNVISRMYEHFLCVYMIFGPVFLFKWKYRFGLKKYKFLFSYRVHVSIWLLAVVMRGADVLIDVFQKASSSGLQNWQYFWPF